MKLYIDADAIPAIAKELIIKTANRTGVPTIFVANRPTRLPPSPHLSSVVVADGFDVADDYIAQAVESGDGVITSDIPLASEVLDKGGWAMNARGEVFSLETIKLKLNSRDFMDMMRGTGVLDPSQMGGQKPYSDKDKKAFADGLNRLVKPANNN